MKDNKKAMEQSMEYLRSYCSSNDYRTFDDYVAYKELYVKEEGEANGEHKKAIETAKNMLMKNMNIEDIVDISGLTKKEIINLQKEL